MNYPTKVLVVTGEESRCFGTFAPFEGDFIKCTATFDSTETLYPPFTVNFKLYRALKAHSTELGQYKPDANLKIHSGPTTSLIFPRTFAWNEARVKWSENITSKDERFTWFDEEAQLTHSKDTGEPMASGKLCMFQLDFVPTRCSIVFPSTKSQSDAAPDGFDFSKAQAAEFSWLDSHLTGNKSFSKLYLIVRHATFNDTFQKYVARINKATPSALFGKFFAPGKRLGCFASPPLESETLVPRKDRPNMQFVEALRYDTIAECYIPEGLALYQEKERLQKRNEENRTFPGQIRLLSDLDSEGQRNFWGFLHMGSNPMQNLEDYLHINLMFDTEFEWEAEVAPSLAFSGYLSADIPLLLRDLRPNKKISPSFKYFEDMKLASLEDIEKYLRDGPTNNVRVRFHESPKVLDRLMEAFMLINPYNSANKIHSEIQNWAKSIKMSLPREDEELIDLLEGTTQEHLNKMTDGLDAKQALFIQYLRSLPKGIGILRGSPGCGKTFLSERFIMNRLRAGKKVAVVCHSNTVADNLACRIASSLTRDGLHKKQVFRIYQEESELLVLDKVPQKLDTYRTMRADINESLRKFSEMADKGRDKRLKKAELSVGWAVTKTINSALASMDRTPLAINSKILPENNIGDSIHEGTKDDVSIGEQLNTSHQMKVQKDLAALHLDSATPSTNDYSQIRAIFENFKLYQNTKDEEEQAEYKGEYMQAYKSAQREIYEDILVRQTDVYVSTPHNMGSPLLKKAPIDVIVVEESQNFLPMTMNIIWAYYPKKTYLLTGDEHQIGVRELESEVDGEMYNSAAKAVAMNVLQKEIWRERPSFTLTVNHRSHPKLVKFYSQIFYDGELSSGLHQEDFAESEKRVFGTFNRLGYRCTEPVIFLNVPNCESEFNGERKSSQNLKEAAAANFIINALLGDGFAASDIMAITGYRAQERQLSRYVDHILRRERSQITQPGEFTQVLRTTLGKAVGSEREIAILCLTRTGPAGFMFKSENLLTAATRPKLALVILGPIRDLHDFMERRYDRSHLYKVLEWGRSRKLWMDLELDEKWLRGWVGDR